jgi:hypothetical protein
MSFTTADTPISDAVSQVDAIVLGLAPAIAMGELYIATSQALANAAANATYNQQQNYLIADAATKTGVALLNKVASKISAAA